MDATTDLGMPRRAARGATVVLCWVAAALLVLAAHQIVDPISMVAAAAAKVAVIIIVAFACVRLTARDAALDQALAVGVTWLLFDIVAELLAARALGHGWYELIGSPGAPWLRNLLMVTWLGAPAIFVRYRS